MRTRINVAFLIQVISCLVSISDDCGPGLKLSNRIVYESSARIQSPSHTIVYSVRRRKSRVVEYSDHQPAPRNGLERNAQLSAGMHWTSSG